MRDLNYEYYHDKDTEITIAKGIAGNINDKPVTEADIPVHFHRCIEILYILEGAMDSAVGSNRYLAKKDNIVFVHNYYAHGFKAAPAYEKIFLVVPSGYGNDFEPRLSHSTLPALMDDAEFNRKYIRPIIEGMYVDPREPKQLPRLIKKGYLNVILGHLLEHYPTVPLEKNSNIEMFVGVLNYIDENHDKPLTLDSLAATFGYNKYYFSRLFNGYVGENLNNYINIVRLQHFMSLYRKEESASIAELAFSCGFDSLTTFYRYFNKIYGKKPKVALAT